MKSENYSINKVGIQLWKLDKILKKVVLQNGEFMPNFVPNFNLALLWNLILSLQT